MSNWYKATSDDPTEYFDNEVGSASVGFCFVGWIASVEFEGTRDGISKTFQTVTQAKDWAEIQLAKR